MVPARSSAADVRCTESLKTRFSSSYPLVSAAAAVREIVKPLSGRRPLRVLVRLASSRLSTSPTGRHESGRRCRPPARGHCLRTRFGKAAHDLRGNSDCAFSSSWHEHRVQASGNVNGLSGKPPSSGSWPAPNSRLKPTRPRSLAGYSEPHERHASRIRSRRVSRWSRRPARRCEAGI